MHEAVFQCQLDIAESDRILALHGVAETDRQDHARITESCRYDHVQLELRRYSVVEIYSRQLASPGARRRSAIEEIDLEMLVVGRFRIVRLIRRPAKRRDRQRQHRRKNRKRYQPTEHLSVTQSHGVWLRGAVSVVRAPLR